MGGYHNIVLPERYSQGSIFSSGFDTRIVELENGHEHRLFRYNAWGRRKYQIKLGNASMDYIRGIHEFFLLRGGAANAFKMFDPFEHASTTNRTSFPGQTQPSDTDVQLESLGGDSFQCVLRYQDSANSVVRPITKIQPGTAVFRADGSPTVDFSIDNETGIVTFGPSVSPVTTATGGFKFYVPVRFADSADKALQVAMQATDQTAALPGVELIEQLGDSTISQDYQYGGAYEWPAGSAPILTSEANGRLQVFSPTVDLAIVKLPPSVDMGLGGPIFAFFNTNLSNDLQVQDFDGNNIGTITPGKVRQVYLGITNLGTRIWLLD